MWKSKKERKTQNNIKNKNPATLTGIYTQSRHMGWKTKNTILLSRSHFQVNIWRLCSYTHTHTYTARSCQIFQNDDIVDGKNTNRENHIIHMKNEWENKIVCSCFFFIPFRGERQAFSGTMVFVCVCVFAFVCQQPYQIYIKIHK